MTHIELASIGSRLKFLRKQMGLTQEQMADKIDLSKSTYRRYEGNESPIPHTALEIITRITNVSLDFLVNGKDLLEDKNETILNIRQNTQFDTKIENGNLVLTTTVPLFKYVG